MYDQADSKERDKKKIKPHYSVLNSTKQTQSSVCVCVCDCFIHSVQCCISPLDTAMFNVI